LLVFICIKKSGSPDTARGDFLPLHYQEGEIHHTKGQNVRDNIWGRGLSLSETPTDILTNPNISRESYQHFFP